LATTSQPEISGAAISVAQHVATTGWILRAFTARRHAWLDWYESSVRGVLDLPPNPEMDCLTDDEPLVDVPARDGFGSVRIYRPRRQFRLALERGEFADDYRTQQLAQLRANLGAHGAAGFVATVTSDVAALSHTGERPVDASKFLRGCVEASAPPLGKNSALVEASRVGNQVGQQTWIGISPSVDATPRGDATAVRVLDVPDRVVLASFRLDVSDAVPPSECTLIADEPTWDSGAELVSTASVSAEQNGRFG
jgi:hypothetical protein